MLPALLEGASSMADIVREGGREYVEKVLQYMIGTGEISDRQVFFDIIGEKVSPEVREEVMSLAQKIRQEGVEEGIKEGIKEGILKTAISMLADGADPKFVAKHTKLSLDEINNLIKNKPIKNENQ
jgi:recombination-promoting nuclease RpnB